MKNRYRTMQQLLRVERPNLIVAFLATGMLLVLLVSVASAAKVAIDTTNGIWDAGWETAFRVDGIGDSTGVVGTDIDNFYVNVNPAGDQYYMGVTLDGSPVDTVHYVVDIDCDDDAIRNEAEDVIIYRETLTFGAFGGVDTGNGSGGGGVSAWEEIGDVWIEWTGNNATLPQATCFAGNRSFRLRVCSDRSCSGTVYDETVSRYLDLPTAVSLQSITATNNTAILPVLIATLLLLLVGGIALRRRA